MNHVERAMHTGADAQAGVWEGMTHGFVTGVPVAFHRRPVDSVSVRFKGF
jgi:hypothetical protein